MYWTRNLGGNFYFYCPATRQGRGRKWVKRAWAGEQAAYWPKGQLLWFYPGASARAKAWPNTDLAPKKIKQKYSKDSASVSWSSKESSDAEGKLLKFVKVMIEKWFDHHFSSFFRGFSFRHKKSALTLAVDQRTWRNFYLNFLRKS